MPLNQVNQHGCDIAQKVNKRCCADSAAQEPRRPANGIVTSDFQGGNRGETCRAGLTGASREHMRPGQLHRGSTPVEVQGKANAPVIGPATNRRDPAENPAAVLASAAGASRARVP